MPYDMKSLALDTTAATSSTILFGAIAGQTDSQPIPIPINILGTYVQANFPSGSVANPTASVGLTAVNGIATTSIRSDGAPALSQAIAPTWTGQHIFNNAITQLGSTSQLQWSTDVILTRSAAATLQFGAADAAAPVAQNVQVQSVVGGTSNTSGANWTFSASKGTGTGTSGGFIWQAALAGASGSSQNALSTVMDYGITFGGSWTITTLGGNAARGLTVTGQIYGNDIQATTGRFIGWANSTLLTNSSSDGVFSISNNAQSHIASVWAAGNNVLQLGLADAAAPVAQTLGAQSVVAGTSNTSGVNTTIRGSASTGTGTGGSLIFQTTPAGGSGTSQNAFSTALTIDSTLLATFATNLRINVAPTANTSASTTITSGADSSTNLGHRISFNLNGTTYWIPCGSTAF